MSDSGRPGQSSCGTAPSPAAAASGRGCMAPRGGGGSDALAVGVVEGAFMGVREHGVGVLDLFEAPFCLSDTLGVLVWVPLQGLASIGCSDLVCGGRDPSFEEAQHSV